MTTKFFDIIIIGSGISGLYSALQIKQTSPTTSFAILEKYKKNWIGGRTSNDDFYETEIVTGAGIGRKSKDKLLVALLKYLDFPINDYKVNPQYSNLIEPVNINKIMEYLKKIYNKSNNNIKNTTFEEFAKPILGEDLYKSFIVSSGYSDYEKEDTYETLYNYGMEDNSCCWKAFHVPWKKMVLKLAKIIGESHFKFSNNVVSIDKIQDSPCKFIIKTESNINYICNRVIIGTTIDTVKNLFPNKPIYNDIMGQPFLRLYGKFSASSIPIMKEYVKGFIFVPGPLQRLIPMDPNKGVYMIAYNDNKNTIALKKHLKNTKENREMYCRLLEKSLGIESGTLNLIAIKDYYWPIGTHYFKPLDKTKYKNREQFINEAQHPENGILVVGEAISTNQGWTEGALESVKLVLTKKWILQECI